MSWPPDETKPTGNGNRFQVNSIHLVIAVVVLAAYLPALLDPDLGSVSLWQVGLVFGLGLVYLVIGTVGWRLAEEADFVGAYVLYFAVQVPIALAASYLALVLPLGAINWILVLPLAAQSLVLPRPGTALVILFLMGGIALQLGLIVGWQEVISPMVGIAAGLVFVLVFTRIAIREQEAREEIERLASELHQANRQLREYAVQVEELATSKERNRLAREIHDSLGHYLTALNAQLGAAQVVYDSDRQRSMDALQKAQRLAQEGLADVRRSVAALRETPLAEKSLPEALSSLLREVEAAGIAIDLEVAGVPRPLDSPTRLTLYRAAQEGLTNARKHAHASRVELSLSYGRDGVIVLVVADNGVGARIAEDGFGLLGLRERVDLLRGDVEITTAAGEGFRLEVRVPG